MSTLQGIAYTDILGRPLIFYLGIITYAFLLATVLLQVLRLRVRRMRRLPRGIHHFLAFLTLGLATLHGLLSISVYF